MFPLSDEIIHDMMERREELEVKLAKKIENVFWEEPLAKPLRTFVRTAWAWMIQSAHQDDFFGDVVDNVIRGSSDKYNLWQTDYPFAGASLEGMEEGIMPHSGSWSPSDCSDLICLWAEVVEAAPKVGAGLTGLAASKEQSRDRVAFDKAHHRRREEVKKPFAVPDHISKIVRDAASRGATRCYLLEDDTVKKIDRMYGLPEGMSISGTTTDSIFFLDHMSSLLGSLGIPDLLPALHLLPLATMVSRYHHTVLECALALSLPPAHKIDYEIGFYTSLMPYGVGQDGGDGTTTGGIGERLLAILFEAQQEARDTHLFAWTHLGDRKGVLFETNELPTCRTLFSVNDKMTAWRAMSPATNCDHALYLWRRCCPTMPLPTPLREDVEELAGHPV